MTVLVAEDSAFYRRVITQHLEEWGFDFVMAQDGKQAWELLAKTNGPKLALLDWVLPDIEGVEVCRRLRKLPESESYVYAILLTAKCERQEMLEAMNAGADDFLPKPFDPPELKARLMVGKRIIELQRKLVEANGALYFSATHDFLTRIWNRGEILGFLRHELVRARRGNASVGTVLVDVDYFKKVNDEFGHQTGDLVIQEIARRLSRSLREYDGVGRYGGEEFLLVLAGCDLATTFRRADEIRSMISGELIPTARASLTVSVSMGVAVTDGSEDAERLLHRADSALYDAKRKGRNRVESSAPAGPLTKATKFQSPAQLLPSRAMQK